MSSRRVYFKIERLDSTDKVIEEKTPELIRGMVKVDAGDNHRRTCNFELQEELPTGWESSRWRLYYGQEVNGTPTYTSLGIFLPIDPVEEQTPTGKRTIYQGVDKTQLLLESYGVAPIQFDTNTTLKEVCQIHYNAIGETKQNFTDLSYVLNTNYTFGEWQSAHHTLTTLVESFTAKTYYDRNGIAVLIDLPAVTARPVTYTFPKGDNSIHVQVKKKIKNSDYFNKVIVMGGNAQTEIYRKELQDDTEIARIGRTVTKHYRYDAATSQDQVDALATARLDEGIRMPTIINVQNFPLTTIEANQIIKLDNVKYEIQSFNIPLDLTLQTIEAIKI